MLEENEFSKEIIRENFEKFYRKTALSRITEFNENRVKEKLSLICAWISFISFLCIFISVKFVFVYLISSAILFCSAKESKSKPHWVCGKDSLKKILMSKFLSLFGNFRWYKDEYGYSKKFYKLLGELQIFPKVSSLVFDDIIKGSFRGVDVEILEMRGSTTAKLVLLFLFWPLSLYILVPALILIISILGTSKITGIIYVSVLSLFIIIFLSKIFNYIRYSVSNMDGILIKYDFPKNFEFNTFLFDNKSLIKRFLYKDWSSYEKVVLEDNEFNKNYTVMSENQVEARYLLTLSLIERFKSLSVAFKAKYQRAEFKDNSLYIFLSTKKNLFEMGNLNEDTTYRTFEDLFDELYSVLSVVEQLKLDQKIGL